MTVVALQRRPGAEAWLREWRASGKRVFLATNSGWDFADLVLRASFSDDWRDLFDLTVVCWCARYLTGPTVCVLLLLLLSSLLLLLLLLW